MSNVLRLCTKCDAEIPIDAPEGGCPGCLLESGLDLLAEDGWDLHDPKPPPHRGKTDTNAAQMPGMAAGPSSPVAGRWCPTAT